MIAGSITVLLLFTSLRTEMIVMTETNPPIEKYTRLQELYASTLKCPCSNITIPYSSILSVSVAYHDVCSSVFVDESWIVLLGVIERPWWYGLDARHFRLLSSICQLIRKTNDDAIVRFHERYFTTLTVISERNLDAQLNTTIDQFIETLKVNFNLLINTTQLFVRVNQPFVMPNAHFTSPLIYSNGANVFNQLPVQVRQLCESVRMEAKLKVLSGILCCKEQVASKLVTHFTSSN